MPDSEVNPAFALLVKAHLSRLGMPAAAFAKAVGISEALMSRMLAAKRYPPETLDKWAEVLGIEGDERERLLETGGLTRCPDYICELVARLQRENQRLRKAAHKG
jgi:hypothetical protein